MRRSIDGLCALMQERLHMDPRQRALYLFCGKRCDRIKASYWEGDGFLLLYKRMEVQGRFRWPRDCGEAHSLTWQQFDWLMSGLEIEQPKALRLPGGAGGILAWRGKAYAQPLQKTGECLFALTHLPSS